MDRKRFPAKTVMTTASLGILAALLAAGCAMLGRDQGPQKVYRAEIRPLNSEAVGYTPTGTAMFEVYEDVLTVTVSLRGLPPDMEHMQHLHGFVADEDASCPGMDADVNNDGFIDLLETEQAAGRTLIPLHDEPANLALQGRYPRAGTDGTQTYAQSIPLEVLKSNVKEKYGIEELDLDDLVIMVHGLPQDARVPPTVKTLPGAPSEATLPIACGKLKEVDD